MTRASSASLTSNTVTTIASSTIVIIIAKGANMAEVVEATTTRGQIITMVMITEIVAMVANHPMETIATITIVATEMAVMDRTVVAIEATTISGTITVKTVDNNQIMTNSTKTQLIPSPTTVCTTRTTLTSSVQLLIKKRLAHSNSRFISSSLKTTTVTSPLSNWTSAKKKSRCRTSCKVSALKV